MLKITIVHPQFSQPIVAYMKRTKPKGFGVKPETDNEPKPIKLSPDSDNPMFLSVKIKGVGKVLVNQIYLPKQDIANHFQVPEDCNYLPFTIGNQKGVLFTKNDFSQAAFVDPSDPAIASQLANNELLIPSLLEIAQQLVALGRISD